MNSLDIQINGNHYKKYKKQPIELAVELEFNALQHMVFKYVYRKKNDCRRLDLYKAIHSTFLAEDLNCQVYWKKKRFLDKLIPVIYTNRIFYRKEKSIDKILDFVQNNDCEYLKDFIINVHNCDWVSCRNFIINKLKEDYDEDFDIENMMNILS